MTDAEKYAHNRAINALADALAAAPMPTIAAINGLALGGGLRDRARLRPALRRGGRQIGLTEARIGAIPGAGGNAAHAAADRRGARARDDAQRRADPGGQGRRTGAS